MDTARAPDGIRVIDPTQVITLDLERPEAVAVLERVVATADVLVENGRPGVAPRLGIGSEALGSLHDYPGAGRVKALGRPVKLSRSPARRAKGAPRLGKDNAAVLGELDLARDEIERVGGGAR